ncbi:Zn-ribbon domain-containing OB-fold protein [Picrophilus oshimae]|uniref:Hypothetical cytosolic protein n=1 Tax=Picrophilus torridus (strain ATCC 700027 / DSM 9790 / JCM 10055 / NBRC 100828 / KAW 2/3) TaxID=1122961 RepID=Q6KZT0_PICTO|nr:Zn-ribbon domain-containing OB-fold protein [Picrophilus oshimae]AAT43772.1 hypothetical cytosolic protein [Picrophilus oshimae DSM 9789]SMD31161.1 hypothetical protein SAMN02745355_1082 [Picrophilus oshimae DSM 9789]
MTDVYKIDPLIIKESFNMDYYHSYAQDSKFFQELGHARLLGSRCRSCGYKYATPRRYCMFCGSETEWIELPHEGKIHSWTRCYFSSESFLEEVPYNLILVEFENIDSLFMSRLLNADEKTIKIGMPVIAKFKKFQDFKITDVYFVPK